MSKMNLKRAVEKLIWRFKKDDKGNFKSFQPNENDFECLKFIIKWIDNQKKESLNDNQLFAKLYIYHLTMNIRHFETTVVDPYPQEDLSKILNKPLMLFYKAFHKDIHTNQLQKLARYNEFNKMTAQEIQHVRSGKIRRSKRVEGGLFPLNEDELQEWYRSKESEKITIEQQKKIIEDYHRYKKTFTLDYVTTQLNHMITEALNRF